MSISSSKNIRRARRVPLVAIILLVGLMKAVGLQALPTAEGTSVRPFLLTSPFLEPRGTRADFQRSLADKACCVLSLAHLSAKPEPAIWKAQEPMRREVTAAGHHHGAPAKKIVASRLKHKFPSIEWFLERLIIGVVYLALLCLFLCIIYWPMLILWVCLEPLWRPIRLEIENSGNRVRKEKRENERREKERKRREMIANETPAEGAEREKKESWNRMIDGMQKRNAAERRARESEIRDRRMIELDAEEEWRRRQK